MHWFLNSAGAKLTCLQTNSSHTNMFETLWEKNTTLKTPNCWEAEIIHPARKENFPLLKLQQMVSSVPKHLLSVVKDKVIETEWLTCPCSNFIKTCCIKFRMRILFSNTMKFCIFKIWHVVLLLFSIPYEICVLQIIDPYFHLYFTQHPTFAGHRVEWLMKTINVRPTLFLQSITKIWRHCLKCV